MRCDEQTMTARAAHGLMLAVKLKGGGFRWGGGDIRPENNQAVCVQASAPCSKLDAQALLFHDAVKVGVETAR